MDNLACRSGLHETITAVLPLVSGCTPLMQEYVSKRVAVRWGERLVGFVAIEVVLAPLAIKPAAAIGRSVFGFQCTTDIGKPKTERDRKSTRLNSSHQIISYAVFCLKKKK